MNNKLEISFSIEINPNTLEQNTTKTNENIEKAERKWKKNNKNKKDFKRLNNIKKQFIY